MLLSQTTEYAVRAMLFIAAREPSAVRASELARSLELPRNYLGKTLGALARVGLLSSTRGPSGGFRLGRAADSITLIDITHAFAPATARRCLLGLGPCGQNPGCPVHHRWLPSAQAIDHFFATTTIAELVAPPCTSAPRPLMHHPLLHVT